MKHIFDKNKIQDKIENIEKELKDLKSIILKNENDKKEKLNENIEKIISHLEKVNCDLKAIVENSKDENFESYKNLQEVVQNYIFEISSLLSKEETLKFSEEFKDISSAIETNLKINSLIEIFTETLNLFKEIKKMNESKIDTIDLLSIYLLMENYEKAFDKYLLDDCSDNGDSWDSLKQRTCEIYEKLGIHKIGGEGRLIVLSDGSSILLTPDNYIFHLKKCDIINNFNFLPIKSGWIYDANELKYKDFKIEILESGYNASTHKRHLTNLGHLIDGFIKGLTGTNLCGEKYQYVKQSIFDIINNMRSFEGKHLKALFYGIFKSTHFSYLNIEYYIRDYSENN